jgi:hypothetical protein
VTGAEKIELGIAVFRAIQKLGGIAIEAKEAQIEEAIAREVRAATERFKNRRSDPLNEDDAGPV